MRKLKTVLVTGASAGIGKAIAIALISAGYDVWGTSRNLSRLESIPGLKPLQLDLGNERSIATALASGLVESGGFDVVINNAGNGIWGSVEHLSADLERAQFQVLVFGPMQIIRGTLPAMRASGHGLIINVTSLAAEFAVPFLGAYSASKAALASMTWNLQMELRQDCVRFVDVQPGDISSDFNEVMFRQDEAAHDRYAERSRRAFEKYDAGMRAAPPPEVVAMVVLKVIERGGRGQPAVAVGDFFQARLAPFLSRFATKKLLRWCTSCYYRLHR